MQILGLSTCCQTEKHKKQMKNRLCGLDPKNKDKKFSDMKIKIYLRALIILCLLSNQKTHEKNYRQFQFEH